jgi:twitching motility protein PilT
MNVDIDTYLELVQQRKASDLHLSSDQRPRLRIDGQMTTIVGEPELPEEYIEQMARQIMPDYAKRDFESHKDTDFSYELPNASIRFRVNVFHDRKGVGLVARSINNHIPSLESLKMPAVLKEVCQLNKGLFIVTGPTGSGKSTTLAAMIDQINSSRDDHIITIEDPVEYVHESKRCLVNQREVPEQAASFARALRAALREDPDVILVGEMRDLETIEMAIETAETGHLVFGTLHTTTAYSAVDRMIDVFPHGRQAQIRTMLASSLKGILAQTLCKKVGGGRVAATELLIITDAAANMIREGNMHQIPSLMQTGGATGMHLMENSLAQLAAAGTIRTEDAWHHANDKELLQKRLAVLGIPWSAAASTEPDPFIDEPDWLKEA